MNPNVVIRGTDTTISAPTAGVVVVGKANKEKTVTGRKINPMAI